MPANKIFNYFTPAKIQAFKLLGRYDKPIGSILIYAPCAWGIALGLPAFSLQSCKFLIKSNTLQLGVLVRLYGDEGRRLCH